MVRKQSFAIWGVDMAKKKENALTYLQSPIPEGQKYYKSTKVSFSGLNKRHTIDTGMLSYEKNISTAEAPYLTPSPKPMLIADYVNGTDGGDFYNKIGKGNILDIYGFDGFLIVLYVADGKTYVQYITTEGYVFAEGVLSETDTTSHRSIVQFNVYDNTNDQGNVDILNGTYVKKLLVFPDKVSMDFDVERNYDTPTKITPASLGAVPTLKYATVHLSRVFGVDDSRVYASGFNDYANWNLDTADEYNESNAWCSPAQANVKADSEFTGITTFQNHVICFKRNFMHEIYNTKNPFRIQDIYAEGTIDNRTIQDVDGRLIFVSDDNVKIYTGSNPKIISYNLNVPKYNKAISGQDGRNYYLYVANGNNKYFFVYDTLIDEWSERDATEYGEIMSFANNSHGAYMAASNRVYRIESFNYGKWSFETDLVTNQTVDIKHIKKLQMLGDFKNCDLDIYALYDDEVFNAKTSHKLYSRTGLNGKHPIRIKPRMTAHYGFKLHFEGEGYAKLYELEIFTQQGGELYV